ncbi:hypothetical protein U6A24_11735 [Aquimarina gracilis]|uniref:DKNYY family protein n=1 Tax=Aquimarina gracilis TaxID=874422 RepID=A0ABU5ZW94_9FLAO|nr:hypothetical protein [Aquimarina gracilis]MEB3346137.1 hypothetical protein [Aquimarina gracilis]
MITKHVTKSICAFLLFPSLFFGQIDKEYKTSYVWFDNMIGREYTGLFNGKKYIDTDINKIFANRHPFFLSDKVLLGTIIYKGQTYYDIPLKYNLETDNLLVSLKSKSSTAILELIKSNISHFEIEGFEFRSLKNIGNTKEITRGFYQIVYENSDMTLYKKLKKNRKKRIEDLGGSKIYFEFIKEYTYILFYDSTYHVVKSKNDIIEIFPDTKQDVKLYYGNNKILKKTEPDSFMKGLFERIASESLLKNDF